MSSSTRKMMFYADVVGELEELAVLAAMSTRKPACFGRVQNEASRDAAHDIFGRDVRVMPLIPNGLHDVLKAVIGDACLHVVTDEFPPGQGPRLILPKVTPGVHGSRNSLRQALQHGGRSAFICSGVALEPFLPLPASGVCHCDVGGSDEVVAIIAHVLLVLQLLAVLFLKEIDRAVRGRNVPTNSRLLPHVFPQELPQGLAEDHVLEVCDPGEDIFGKCVRTGTHEKRMSGLAVDDALKDVVFLDPYRH